MLNTRRSFLAAVSIAGGAATIGSGSSVLAAGAPASPAFDRAAFEARIRLPFRHRQAFAGAAVSDGAVFGFMANSLDAYERGFGEGPGTLHVAAVLYRTGVVMALDDDAWRALNIVDFVHGRSDRATAPPGAGNPFLSGPTGRTIADLQQRNASLFVCRNALEDVARHLSTNIDALRSHLIPGAMVVPAGVAAINALQEERFTLFVAAV